MTPPLPVEFIGSFPDPEHPLDPPKAEFALLGRSNVGKSTLLNALVGHRRLARVSREPGKTALLNVFRLPACYLLDLPGYGYARRSRTDRTGFRALVEGVLRRRASLTGVVWLLDVRHPPSAEDLVVRELLLETGRPLLAVLTKADKLPRSRHPDALRARAAELGLPEAQLLLTSATTGLGIGELRDSLLAAARHPAA